MRTIPSNRFSNSACIDQYLYDEYHIVQCAYKLLQSPVFIENRAYVRRQFLYCLLQVRRTASTTPRHKLIALQDDDASTLHIVATVCLYDGRNDESVLEMIQQEGALSRLIELISAKPDGDNELHRSLLELLYEMARVQKLERDDLGMHIRDMALRC